MLPTFADFRIWKTVFGRDMSHGSRGARPFRFAPTVLALALLCLAMNPGPAEARPPAPRPALDGARGSILPPGVTQAASGSAYLGPDQIVATSADMESVEAWTSIQITYDGEIFAAVSMDNGFSWGVNIFHSTDHGETWGDFMSFWGQTGVDYVHPVLHVAEGTVRRLFVGYIERNNLLGSRTVSVAYVDLDDLGGTPWQTQQLTSLGFEVSAFDLTSTARGEGDYAVAVTASHPSTVAPGGIRIIRSADQGTTWGAAYAVTVAPSGYEYYGPRITMGLGRVLHLAWSKYPAIGGPGGNVEVLYSRALNFAENGPADWQGVFGITSTYNGADEYLSGLAAAEAAGDVVLSIDYGDTPGFVSRTTVRASYDMGGTWSGADSVSVPGMVFTNLLASFGKGFTLAGFDIASQRIGYTKAVQGTPLSWSAVALVSDAPVYTPGDPLAPRPGLDDSHTFDEQVGFVWHVNHPLGVDPDSLFFDAEWFTNPGFPLLEANYPLWIPWRPQTNPILVDVDGDPDLELVFADENKDVNVLNPDGTDATGWPIYLGIYQGSPSIAVGDVDMDGANEVVVGGVNRITVFEGDGTVAAGYPVDFNNPGQAAWVAVGPILNSESNQVVAACGDEVHVLSFGVDIPGYPLVKPEGLHWAPAIGDLDGDGFNEIVTLGENGVYADRRDGSALFARSFSPEYPVLAPTLADFDLDGDREVVVPTYIDPTDDGRVYVLDETGADIAPWPLYATRAITGVSLADLVGGTAPELVIGEASGTVTVRQFDGSAVPSWPNHAGTTALEGAPTVDVIDENGADVLAGSLGDSAYAWTHDAGAVPGWPRNLANDCWWSPASGDVDQDGSLEIVFLTDHWIYMFDVNATPSTYQNGRWPMFGHDPAQTQCLNCSIPSTVGVPDLDTGFPARLMLAPSPNPMTASSRIAFRCAPGSTATLAIYDLNGRRVRSFFDGRPAEGPQEVTWNGVDDTGRRVASGVYYVRLVVEDETGTKTESRRLIVLP